MKPTYIVGDVHGCLRELQTLLSLIFQKIGANPGTIVFVGDLIDKGPDSLGCLRQVKDLQKYPMGIEVVFVIGNHEDKLIRWLQHEQKIDLGLAVTNPIKALPEWDAAMRTWGLKQGGLRWLRSCPMSWSSGNGKYHVVHAGIEPKRKAIPVCPWLEAKGKDKTVFFTRYVNPEKGKMVALGQEVFPRDKWWGELYDGRFGTVIYGHQPFDEVRRDAHAVGIDTSCVYGGCLTAYDPTTGETLEVKAFDVYSERMKDYPS
jgi:serine/threonine protein phosphatase 1